MRGLYSLALALPSLLLLPACRGKGQDLQGNQHKRDQDFAGRVNRQGISLPITKSLGAPNRRKRRRGASTGAIGLGDYLDVVYNVLVTIGGTTVPVVLDTGSSDLWVISDACTTGCGNVAKYPQSSFNSTGLDVQLLYGSSSSSTSAFGLIGTDAVSVAGLSLPGQYFAAINSTNTTVSETGSAGILGLGFPINSIIFHDVLSSPTPGPDAGSSNPPKLDIHWIRSASNLNPPIFPALSRRSNHDPSQSTTSAVLASFSTIGPLIARLVATGSFPEPLFAVTLQRDTIEIGGNVGSLNIGQLPANVQNGSLTWVPIRGYTVDQGGLRAPSNSPHEVYPMTWEVFLDDVYLDGQRLPRSQLSSPDIELSALIDTGNTFIRGPSDVVEFITSTLGPQFPCNEPHTLAFSIGGQMFPVDPRDLIQQVDVSMCAATLSTANTPVVGRFLYSWSLGAPFLKGVLSAYYYGNLSYPSYDPARMGFLSTVPSDAGEQLQAEANSAVQNGGSFPSRIESAPTGSPTGGSLNSNGVATVTATSTTSPSHSSSSIPSWDDSGCGILVGINVMFFLMLSLW
ncbi:aspartic peptidase domain-containing protein [Amanita rubescens]|nr:aspartic peptidase domain-containing protein [Amanita rubescens]